MCYYDCVKAYAENKKGYIWIRGQMQFLWLVVASDSTKVASDAFSI